MTKLERHVDALNFIKLHVEDKHLSKINLFIELISKWKYTLRKEKKALNHQRLEKLSNVSSLDMDRVEKFIKNKHVDRV